MYGLEGRGKIMASASIICHRLHCTRDRIYQFSSEDDEQLET